MASGQDPEKDLLDLIEQSVAYTYQYTTPLGCRMASFSRSLSSEASHLQYEELELKRRLRELALQISNGQDVSLCLEIALEDADRIFDDRGEYIAILV